MINGHDRAISALHAIPNDLAGEDWLRPSMAARAAGIDFADWHSWCQGAPNYRGEVDCRTRWKSFDPNGPIQAGTLFKLAADHGWSPTKNASPRPAPAKATTKPAVQRKQPAPGQSASEVFARCEPATNQHDYVVAKGASGVPLDNLRVVPAGDPLRIAGQSMAGYLAVPCYRTDGAIQSIQFVPSTGGKKLNLPGASMAGTSFTLGTEGPVYICEGIGAAWACWQATGHRAVCCFGWGNVKTIAAQLRQQDDTARLVICPDVGKEDAAKPIASEFSCAVARMPEGWPANSDVNDLAQRDGGDVLELLLESASEPPRPEPKVHPLARYADIDGTAKPPRWVIPGFIGHGVTVISGAHGVGKTTALLPLALTAAGLHGDDLMPRQWRHVVYVTEDVEQARRILAGITLHSNLGISLDLVRERFHLVEAVRLDPVFVATVGATYREQFTRNVQGVEVLPLVVLDTKSAVLAVESENDNSEASRMMSALKQGFDGLPVWLIGHVAKANLTRNDALLTSRGAGAIEGDANQTLFLVKEGDCRYLVLGKTRFEPRWPELEITSHATSIVAPDEFGNPETVFLRWGIVAPAQTTRKEAAEQVAEQQRKDDEASLRQDVRDVVEVAWIAGNPLNRAGVKAKIRRKAADVVAALENLLNERWLYEVTVPAKERTNNSKAVYLVNLTTKEHEAVLSDGGLPADKLVIPATWQKKAIPVVPEPEGKPVEACHE